VTPFAVSSICFRDDCIAKNGMNEMVASFPLLDALKANDGGLFNIHPSYE
jgi:hypothetical protein